MILEGDSRTVVTKDGRTVVIRRTGRAYAQDLADAYNAARTTASGEWYVKPNGDLALRSLIRPTARW